MYLKSFFPKYGAVGEGGGSLLISGRAEMGARKCFEGIYEEYLSEGHPIFIAHDYLSAGERIGLLKLAREYGYGVSWFGPGASSCEGFDILSALHTPEQKATLICQLLLTKKNEAEYMETAYRYLRDAVIALGGEGCRLQNVLRMSIEEVQERIRRSDVFSEEFREDECSFLETKAVFSCWGMLNDRAAVMSAGGFLEALSGDAEAWEIFGEKRLIMVSKSPEETDPAGLFRGTVNGMLQMAAFLCEQRKGEGGKFHILLDGTLHIKPDLLDGVLHIAADAGNVPLPVCIYQASVADLLERHSPAIMGRFRGAAVFQTIEGEYWSSFFGTMLSAYVVQSYSRKRMGMTLNPHGGVVGNPRGKFEGTSVHRMEKPVYEARFFTALRKDSCLFYDLYTGRKGKKAF